MSLKKYIVQTHSPDATWSRKLGLRGEEVAFASISMSEIVCDQVRDVIGGRVDWAPLGSLWDTFAPAAGISEVGNMHREQKVAAPSVSPCPCACRTQRGRWVSGRPLGLSSLCSVPGEHVKRPPAGAHERENAGVNVGTVDREPRPRARCPPLAGSGPCPRLVAGSSSYRALRRCAQGSSCSAL